MRQDETNSQMDVLHDLLLNVGKVRGILEAMERRQQEQSKWMYQMDTRLRHVERKAALNGLMAGGLVGVAVTILGYALEGVFRLKG